MRDTYIYIHTHIYIHMHIHTHTNTNTPTHIHTHTHTHTYTHTYTHTNTHTHAYKNMVDSRIVKSKSSLTLPNHLHSGSFRTAVKMLHKASIKQTPSVTIWILLRTRFKYIILSVPLSNILLNKVVNNGVMNAG